MPKKEAPLTPKALLGMLQESQHREALLRHENALLRDRLMLHEDPSVVRRLVYAHPAAGAGPGELILIGDDRVVYRPST